MTEVSKVDGVSNYVSDGSKYILSYLTDDKTYYFHGTHNGQITGKNITIEYFDTEEELNSRMEDLSIVVPDINLLEVDDEEL